MKAIRLSIKKDSIKTDKPFNNPSEFLEKDTPVNRASNGQYLMQNSPYSLND